MQLCIIASFNMYGSINMQSATLAIKRKEVLFVFVKQAQLSSVYKSRGQEHKAAFKHQKKNKNKKKPGTGRTLDTSYVLAMCVCLQHDKWRWLNTHRARVRHQPPTSLLSKQLIMCCQRQINLFPHH